MTEYSAAYLLKILFIMSIYDLKEFLTSRRATYLIISAIKRRAMPLLG